jgi:hypothetical protein
MRLRQRQRLPQQRFADRWYCESGNPFCSADNQQTYATRLFTDVPPFSVDLSDASSSFAGIVVSICTNQVYSDEAVIIDSLQINVTYAPLPTTATTTPTTTTTATSSLVCLPAVERKVALSESGVEFCQPCPPGLFSPPLQPNACISAVPLCFLFAESFADTFPDNSSSSSSSSSSRGKVQVFAARVQERVAQVIGWPAEYVLNVSITAGSIVAAMGVPTSESWHRFDEISSDRVCLFASIALFSLYCVA